MIVAVVLLNALIRVIQKNEAEKILDTIREMLSQQATVIREGNPDHSCRETATR